MIITLASSILLVCNLSSFGNMPSNVEGTLVLETKTKYMVKVEHNGSSFELAVDKKLCKKKG